MAHTHHDHSENININKRLIFGIALNSLFVIVEFAVAIFIGSLALLSDAGHNFADSFALMLALYATLQARRLPTQKKTFGYFRTGVLAALFNSTVLIVITIYIFYEAYFRIIHPPKVPGLPLLIVASVGFILNLVVAIGFKGQKDINIRAAFLHLITDALVSLSVVVAALVIIFTGFNLIDPIISVIIGIFILYSTYDVTREAVDILMESTPKNIDMDAIIKDMQKISTIKNVHHMHIWEIGSGVLAMSCHIIVDDMPVSKSDEIISQLELMLAEDHGIVHPTIQIESEICGENGTCNLPHT